MVDLSGLFFVGFHFFLLGAPAGALLCGAYALKDILGLIGQKQLRLYLGVIAGVIIAAMIWATETSWATAWFAVAGSLVALASRIASKLRNVLLLIAISTVFWGVYGYLVGSIGQTIFSIVYFLLAVSRAFNMALSKPCVGLYRNWRASLVCWFGRKSP